MRATDVSASPVHDSLRLDASGARGVGEFRCSECGYGIVSRGVLPDCRMCHGSSWAKSPWRPFARQETG